MKINNREKGMLILLLFVLVAFGYYWFIIKPLESDLQVQLIDLENKKLAKMDVDMRLDTEPRLTQEIADNTEALKQLSIPYYSDISNEEMLMSITKLSQESMVTLTEVDYIADSAPEDDLNQKGSDVKFTGSYETLIGYLQTIEGYDKKIGVSKLTVQRSLEGEIEGRISLVFSSIPKLKSYDQYSMAYLALKENTRDVLLNPFAPFDGFVWTSDETPVVYPTDEPEIDYENYRPKTQIESFEDGSSFFVGSSDEMTGSINRNQLKISDGYSAELNFDFITAREFNEANLVFDTNPVMIPKQAEYLGVWMYAYEAGNHAVGAVLIDSSGREFRVYFENSVNWVGWKEIEVSLPIDISYPCKVQRLFVEGKGYEQKLHGKYLFDQLEVSYPVE